MTFSDRKNQLLTMFNAALDRVDPYKMLMDHVRLKGSLLFVDLGDEQREFDLAGYEKILIVGAGKATAPMARAMENILGGYLSGGVISVKYGHTAPLQVVETIEAGHPVPDVNGERAARRILELADTGDEKTLFISLISGGGSALLPLPATCEAGGRKIALTLADKQETTSLLLACGADIEEINCIRKHLSAIKGGRLLERMAPARNISFILSDVVGDNLSSIASGATCGDPTTFHEAREILEKYDLYNRVPPAVKDVLDLGCEGLVPETPKAGDSSTSKAENILIGTNLQALDAAAAAARKLGYQVVRLTSRIGGEAREVARTLADIAIDCEANGTIAKAPVCILSGGEPVVQLRGAGKGGRNQEMALAYLLEMKRNRQLCSCLTFLAASTDGNDGPTDAAGAFADLELLDSAEKQGLNPQQYLADNDSYHFYEKCDGLVKTGPTNTNVCDLHISLVWPNND